MLREWWSSIIHLTVLTRLSELWRARSPVPRLSIRGFCGADLLSVYVSMGTVNLVHLTL